MRREKEAAEKLLQQVSLNKEELVQDISSKLSEQLLSQVKAIVSSNSSKAGAPGAGGCELKNLKNALDPEKASPVPLDPDMIYMGEDQKPLPMREVLSVQRKVFTFPGRVKKLVDLMYPKKVHLLFSKKNASNTEAILITDDAIACLANILLSMQWTKNEKPKNPISDRMVKRVVEQYSSYLRAELKKKEQPAEVLKALREKRSQQRQARKGKKLYTIKNGNRHYVNKREKKSAEADADMSHNSDSDQSKETPVHDVVPSEDSSSDESSNGRDSNCSQSHGVGPENTEEVDVEDNESQIINLDQNGQELYSHLSADFISTRASKRSHDGDELQWSELSDASETSNLNSGNYNFVM
ncbi:hypothetical protein FOCC_FOCC008308 [Frankliniella occidentalis]|nr:hypothetical protein FOCC_FOCC008308 [Frankliniella occidentalis]